MSKYAGTQTEKNLQAAFAGESQATNKYTYFASVAKSEGYEQIAEIFRKTSANEQYHAKMWFRELEGIGNTAENHLVGRLGRQDLAALMSQADAMALPSRSEGFATTLLEAAACATPAIVTPVGGTDELVSGERFGTIIPNARTETVEAALREAARNPQRLAEQGENVARRVRAEYSWRRTAERTLAACRKANEK